MPGMLHEVLSLESAVAICAFLDPPDVVMWSMVSFSFYDFFNDDEIWKALYFRRWNHHPDMPQKTAVLKKSSTRGAGKTRLVSIAAQCMCVAFKSANVCSFAHSLLLPPQDSFCFFKGCFKNAYANPHDLWLTHWTLTLPRDHDGVGRVCVPDIGDQRRCPPPDVDELSSTSASVPNVLDVPKEYHDLQHLCPTCRYHPSYVYSHLHVEKTLDNELKYHDEQADKRQAEGSLSCDPIEQAKMIAFSHTVGVATACLPATASHAQSVYYSLNYSTAKAARFMRLKYQADLKKSDRRINTTLDFYNNIRNATRREAESILKSASTFHRTLPTSQFNSCGTNFLQDLVFVLAHPPEMRGKEEYSADAMLKAQVYNDKMLNAQRRTFFEDFDADPYYHPIPPLESLTKGTMSTLGPKAEHGQHSMHVTRLTNPSLTNPISWRAVCSRTDAFSCFPSEGMLGPGQTIHLYFTVRPLGSLMASSAHIVDTERACTDHRGMKRNEYECIYYKEGKLPQKPFEIRYIVAPMTPMLPPGYDPHLSGLMLVDYMWQHAKPWEIKAIKLSAHVNPALSLEEVEYKALIPFEFTTKPEKRFKSFHAKQYVPNTFVAPYLESRKLEHAYFTQQNAAWGQMNDMDDTLTSPWDNNLKGGGNTEGGATGCKNCGKRWGRRQEVLGRNYMLRRYDCEAVAYLNKVERGPMLKANLDEVVDKVTQMFSTAVKEHEKLVNGDAWKNATKSKNEYYKNIEDEQTYNDLVRHVSPMIMYMKEIGEDISSLACDISKDPKSIARERFRVEKKYPPKNDTSRYSVVCDPQEEGKELPNPFLNEKDFASAIAFERGMLKEYKELTKNVSMETMIAEHRRHIWGKRKLIAKRLLLRPRSEPPPAAEMVFFRQKINETREEIRSLATIRAEYDKGSMEKSATKAYALYKMQNAMDHTEMESYAVVYRGVYRMFLKSIKNREQPQINEEEQEVHRKNALLCRAVLEKIGECMDICHARNVEHNKSYIETKTFWQDISAIRKRVVDKDQNYGPSNLLDTVRE